MDDTVRERIEGTLKNSRVVLFMKGNRNFPQCGFSAKVVEVLKRLGVEFRDVNVLSEPGMRDGIKEFANWPTIPQLYVDGKLVGGCDIVSELYESGELAKLLAKSSGAGAPRATKQPS